MKGEKPVQQSVMSTVLMRLAVMMMSPVAFAMRLMVRVLQAQGRWALYFSGIPAEYLRFPSRNEKIPYLIDIMFRWVKLVWRIVKVAIYPEILFRNIVFIILFQSWYGFGSYGWRHLRRYLYELTKEGRHAKKYRQLMEGATTYDEFRSAEKAYEAIRYRSLQDTPLTQEEQDICNKLDRRFERYRELIRAGDTRRLQFELRAGLLRKHFGHDQFHPLVQKSIHRYVGIVCSAFGLLAVGSVPAPLRDLVYCEDDDENIDVHEKLDDYEGQRQVTTNKLVERDGSSEEEDDDGHMEQEQEDEDDDNEEEEEDDDFFAGGSVDNTFDEVHGKYGTVIPPVNIFEDRRVPDEEKLRIARNRFDFFTETRHSFGRTALLLSGGARMGLYHVGVIKTFLEHNLLPRVISGSSAGSIIAAMLACKTDEEVERELFHPEALNLRFFGRCDSIDMGLQSMLKGEEPPDFVKDSLLAAFTGDNSKGNSLFGTLLMLLPPPFPSYIMLLRKLLPRWAESKTLLDIEILKTAIRNVIGDMTFGEAFQKTGRIVNITATPHGGDRDVPNLLNYLSAPYVTLWSAACASSCIPGVFAPVRLMAKTIDGTLEPYSPAGLRWLDGSLEADLPMARLSELFNINHFVVSQVNPHSFILAPHETRDLSELDEWDRQMWSMLGRAVTFARDQSRSYLKHVAGYFLKAIPSIPFGNGLVPLLVQKYSGDVTIYPKLKMQDFAQLIINPTDEEYRQAILEGQRMAWPKVQQIRRRCMTEFMLDDCVHAMRHKIEKLERKIMHTRQNKIRSHNILPPTGMSRVSSYSMFQGKYDADPEDEEAMNSLPPPSGLPSAMPIISRNSRTSSNSSGAGLEAKLMNRIQSKVQLNRLDRGISFESTEEMISEGDEDSHMQEDEDGRDMRTLPPMALPPPQIPVTVQDRDDLDQSFSSFDAASPTSQGGVGGGNMEPKVIGSPLLHGSPSLLQAYSSNSSSSVNGRSGRIVNGDSLESKLLGRIQSKVHLNTLVHQPSYEDMEGEGLFFGKAPEEDESLKNDELD